MLDSRRVMGLEYKQLWNENPFIVPVRDTPFYTHLHIQHTARHAPLQCILVMNAPPEEALAKDINRSMNMLHLAPGIQASRLVSGKY